MNKQATLLEKLEQLLRPTSKDRERTLFILTAICLVLSLIISSALWFRQDRLFLPSPILPLILKLPFWTDYLFFGSVLLSTVILLAEPRYRWIALVYPIVFILWILQDSLRWQPFLYMYAFVFLTIFANRKIQENRNAMILPLQIMVIGVYFWAGIGKINPYFHEMIFPWFIQPWIKDAPVIPFLSYTVPFVELLIGVFLAIPALRRVGLFMALGMLTIVLLCLGPLGHNWGAIVWPWNVFLFCLACICFIHKENSSIFKAEGLKRPITILAILLFWVLPLGGQFGYWGAHPSFKLYSGDIAIADITLSPKEKTEDFPPIIAAATADHTTSLFGWVFREFMIATTPSIPGYGSYLDGAKGICRYLRYPDEAVLVTQTLPLKPEIQAHRISTKEPLCR